MKRLCTRLTAIAALVLAGWGLMAAANAAPPTVTPSPGYDARLQEQRAAQKSYTMPNEGVVRRAAPTRRHHVKRVHHDAH
jgi:hypothetical protein